MVKMISKIKEIVEKECKKKRNIFTFRAYTHHIVPVVKYAKQLAKKLNADEEIVEIASWLHDIGSIIGDYENHHISGAKYAENLLKKFNYPENRIKKIKHCIIAHRASKKIPRKSVEAECVASADSMIHFNDVHGLFFIAYHSHKLNSEESKEFVKNKLERSWNKLIPEAKEIIKPKYEAVKELLK